MKHYLFIPLMLIMLVPLNLKAQTLLTLETQENISKPIESLNQWYAVNPARESTNPFLSQVSVTNIAVKSILHQDKEFPLVKERLILDIIKYYHQKHFNQCQYLLALAEWQKKEMGKFFIQNHIPEDLIYLSLVISAMNPEYSTAEGNLGAWQFKYTTGRFYHLNIDEFVDERRDIKRSSEAAALMLHDFYNRYNDWSLAITAFVCGPINLNKAIRKASGSWNYEDIYDYLPSPERDVYPSFLALRLLMNNPNLFHLTKEDLSLTNAYDTVWIEEKLHLGQVSEVLKLDQALLCHVNPVYFQNIIPGDKVLPLLLPAGKSQEFTALKDSIFAYKDSSFFNIKPPEVVADIPKPNTPDKNFSPVDYTVKSGDNLGYISIWFDVKISEIRIWNNIRGNAIRAGQKLVVYVPKKQESYYVAVDKLTFKQKQAREGKIVKAETTQPKPQKTETLKTGEYEIYVVKSGDNPWTIAKKYPGVSNQDILRWNDIKPKNLRPGQKLKIKKVKSI